MAREFVLLGEVGIRAGDDVAAAITQPRLRGLLAALLVDVNTGLSCDTLVDRVWGDGPARSGTWRRCSCARAGSPRRRRTACVRWN
jgi:hypothetical protein